MDLDLDLDEYVARSSKGYRTAGRDEYGHGDQR